MTRANIRSEGERRRLGLALLLALLLTIVLTACSTPPEDPGPSAPAMPTGLRASSADAQVILNWNANPESDLKGYGVYQGTTSGTLSKVADIPAGTTTYTASGLTNGSAYFFAVDAVNTAEQRSSWSAEVKATPTAPDPGIPAIPVGLRATAGDGVVTLEWNANSESDLLGYGVYQGTASGALAKVADIPAGTTTYTASGLTNGTSYRFAVDAVNSADQRSARSAAVSATPRSDNPGPTAPATPTGLGASPGDGQVVLNWSANAEADLAGYGVYGGTASGSLTKVADIPAGTTSYTATDLTNGTLHFFAVDALNTANQRSARSGEISVAPTATPLPTCTFGSSSFGACTLGP